MARIAFIVILLLWLAKPEELPPVAAWLPTWSPLLFVAGYGLLLAGVRWRAVAFASRPTDDDFDRRAARWSSGLQGARLLIVAWFGCGIYLLGWPAFAQPVADLLFPDWLETPSLLIGTLPALLAWLALWWAAYPAEDVIRCRRALVGFEAGWPVAASPTLREHLLWNLRTNMLFTLAPIVAIFLLRDLAWAAWSWRGEGVSAGEDLLLSAVSAMAVLLLTPPLLVRILPTRPLPASPLRARLQALCEARGLRYRDIRLWESNGVLANAAVMGILPQTRYLVLSDLVIEAMPEEQVLAVFGHETAHVLRHHLAWMGLTVLTYMVAAEVASRTLMPWLTEAAPVLAEVPGGLLGLGLGLPLFVLFFGFMSRGFERQADVLAARALAPQQAPGAARRWQLPTAESALTVAAALDQIARLNHINPRHWEWLHGSIAARCAYLELVAREPQRAAEFDRVMRRLCGGLLVALVVLGVVLARLTGVLG